MTSVAMLAPIAWPTPPSGYGPWEQVVATLTDALVRLGVEVTLYATGDSRTPARLVSVVPHGYEEDHSYDVKVYEALHIPRAFEQAAEHDLVHNHFDFLPLCWSRLVSTPVVTTIHGLSSEAILPVYRAYNDRAHYVAISEADRHPDLVYAATIHHGIDLDSFPFSARPTSESDGHLVFLGRIHPDKGAAVTIDIARGAGRQLYLAGIVHDRDYFEAEVRPRLGPGASYLGTIGGEDRARLLGEASALLHPVAFAEPFGLSVIEALACGTPVVAFPKGALPELVRHGVTGYLVGSVADAIVALSSLSSLEDISRAECRADAEARFSARRMATDYLALYQQILSEKPVAERGSLSPSASAETARGTGLG
jgi:glycosyltransferase involved in cell wall biosynthesis